MYASFAKYFTYLNSMINAILHENNIYSSYGIFKNYLRNMSAKLFLCAFVDRGYKEYTRTSLIVRIGIGFTKRVNYSPLLGHEFHEFIFGQ